MEATDFDWSTAHPLRGAEDLEIGAEVCVHQRLVTSSIGGV